MASFNTEKSKDVKAPSMLQALVPIVFLLGLILFNVVYLGEDPLAGGSQLSLALASLIAGVIAYYNGVSVETLFNKIEKTISSSLVAILILLSIV